jgi:hypothetical protein
MSNIIGSRACSAGQRIVAVATIQDLAHLDDSTIVKKNLFITRYNRVHEKSVKSTNYKIGVAGKWY